MTMTQPATAVLIGSQPMQGRQMSVLALAVLVCAAAVFSPQSAHAALYNVWACANGSGGQLGTGDWQPQRIGGELQRTSTDCNTGISGTPAAAMNASADPAPGNAATGAGAGWGVKAAPGTTIKELVVWWYHCATTASAAQPPGRMQVYAGTDSIYSLEGTCWGRSGIIAQDNAQTFSGLNVPNVTLQAWCLVRCNTTTGFPAAYFSAYRIKVVVDDPSAPTGTVDGLTDGMRIGAGVPLSVRASDAGSGVSEVSLRIDDRVVQGISGEGRCADVEGGNDTRDYDHMRPCPADRSATFALDPAKLPDIGPHVVTVVATNAAGQDAVLSRARVALSAPPGFFGGAGFVNPDLNIVGPRALNGVNAGPGSARLSFVVGRGKRTRYVTKRVMRSSERQQISGRLTNVAGRPIGGARIWRFVALSKGIWQLSGQPLTTSPTGGVRGWLSSRRSSREVRLVYFPYTDSSDNVQSPARSLAVRSATTIQVDQTRYRNGGTVRFSGRITSRPMTANKAVYLQTRVRGRWRTFGTTRAVANGRWKFGYRFEATRRRTLYLFRAVIPPERGLVSWATGHSRTVRVLVVP